MRFGYRAYDAQGRIVEGEVTAESRESALDVLHQRGEIAVAITDSPVSAAQPWWNRQIRLFNSVSLGGLALFTRELATLLKADLPLDETLRIVALQPSLPGPMRRTTDGVLNRVLEGQALSQALAAEPAIFSEFYWRLVRGGEASGSLGDVLDDLAAFLERSAEMRAKVLSALLYPAILLAVAALAVVAIMAVLLPAIVPLLRDTGAPLPLIVTLLEGTRAFLANNVFLLAVIGAGVAVGLAIASATGILRPALSRILLRMPFARTLIMRREVSRFARTLATLIRSGVPLLEATRITGGVLSNAVYREATAAVAEDLRQGVPLTRALTARKRFPDVALRLVAVGEKSGQLETMLLRVAEIFEAALQRQLNQMTVLLTPVLTLVIGLLVGGLIVSVMGALLSINELALT